MDIKTAKLLLQQIRQVKQAGEAESPNFSRLARHMPTSLADITPAFLNSPTENNPPGLP